MEAEILKHFINQNVEILIGGVWIEGQLKPIVKGVITLVPYGETAAFYGPTALKMENVQAIRQVKTEVRPLAQPSGPSVPPAVKSSMEDNMPGKRFVIAKNK